MVKLTTIITNRALNKMAKYGLSEKMVLDVFNTGKTEEASIGGWNAIKKYSGREIGVYYNRRPDGQWVIISVWVRNRR
jgi:hypothetical protein